MKQICRKKVEIATLQIETQSRTLFLQRDQILKDILCILKKNGQDDLLAKLKQVQYEIDDAMYIAIYRQALRDFHRFNKSKKQHIKAI
jgi:hypothetical protein